jgi:hypothetical protein
VNKGNVEMVKIEEILEPGELVQKDSGTLPVAHDKGVGNQPAGKLYLTNKRLIFTPSAIVYFPLPAKGDVIQIPLESITSVKKGWNNITIHTTNEKIKFVFGVRPGKDEWVQTINNAITKTHVQQTQQSTQLRCPSCGNSAQPGDRHCGFCGGPLYR